MTPKILETALARENAKFNKQLKQLARLSGQTTEEVLWKYSSIFVGQLIRRTQPFGTGAKARQVGEKAVARDIARVYISPSKLYARVARESRDSAEAVYWAIMNGQDEDAAGILKKLGLAQEAAMAIGQFDGGGLHQSARDHRGRVPARNRQAMIVRDPSAVSSYAEQVQHRVGGTKAQWLNGFNPRGGTRGIPRWVVAAGPRVRGRGRFETRRVAGDLVMYFENTSPWIGVVFDRRGAENSLNIVARRMARDATRKLAANPKRV